MTRVQPGNTPPQQKANALRGDSPHGKQKELATLYLDYKPRMEELEADENTQHQTRAKSLRRDLFGLPGYADQHRNLLQGRAGPRSKHRKRADRPPTAQPGRTLR